MGLGAKNHDCEGDWRACLKATILNGTYVDTGEKGILKKLFKKTSMFRGIQPILRINSQKRWIISAYDKGDNGFALSLQMIEKGKDVFMEEIKWEVYDVDKKKDWKTYPDMTATVISGSDLVWTLDDCDVVIKKVAEDMVDLGVKITCLNYFFGDSCQKVQFIKRVLY